MCGRTACTLAPEDFPKACQYRDRNGSIRQPQWSRKNSDCSKYAPSYNIAPQSYTPVLVSPKRSFFSSEGEVKTGGEGERELCVMKWGLIPSWYRGDPDEFGFKMNNARIESITEKKSFKNPLEKGRRCVVLAEGFYEWQAGKGGQKQPYFIHFKKDVKTDFKDTLSTSSGHLGSRPLLTMAGIYDLWKSSQTQIEPLCSYSVITLEAIPPYNILHHRVPAILKDDTAVQEWLDCENVSYSQALKSLTPVDCLEWHPVSPAVNNSRYQEPDCIKPIDLSHAAKKAESGKITNWFQRSPKKRESPCYSDDKNIVKKFKQDTKEL